jgi:N-acetylglucosamine kinase-like BadF-type ATPase
MALFIGIDGGGSKTEAVVLSTDRKQAISVIGPAANPQTVGLSVACEVVMNLIRKGLAEFGAGIDDVEGFSFCMAGVDSEEEAEAMRAQLYKFLPSREFEVVNDSLSALFAGTSGGPGVVLIAGTGSIAMGEDEHGNIVRSGGFGNLIGDEGSGFDIGRLGLIAAIQGFEGRGPATAIWEAVKRHFGVSEAQELIAKIYGSSHPVGTIASFAGKVIELSDKDESANQIVDQALISYGTLIDSVYRKLEDSATYANRQLVQDVILAGGLFVHYPFLITRLENLRPRDRFCLLKDKPAFGALLRAMKRKMGQLTKEDIDLWRISINSIKSLA